MSDQKIDRHDRPNRLWVGPLPDGVVVKWVGGDGGAHAQGEVNAPAVTAEQLNHWGASIHSSAVLDDNGVIRLGKHWLVMLETSKEGK